MAITATIDRYSYVILNERGNGGGVQLDMDSEYQIGGPADRMMEGLRTRVHEAILNHFEVARNLSIFITSQIPDAAGFGTITSEALALAKSLAELRGERVDPMGLADLVTRLEIEGLDLPLGKQNHYACAFGGLNCITFQGDGTQVSPIELEPAMMAEFESRLMLFYTNRPSNWIPILGARRRASERNRAGVVQALHSSKRTAVGLFNDLSRGNIETVGGWMDEQWSAKKKVAGGVSDAWIDQWYDAALQAGATGGKLVGAGGGGFLLLYCVPSCQPVVVTSLESLGLRRVPFQLDPGGTTTSTLQTAVMPYASTTTGVPG